MKCVQIRSFFWCVFSHIGTEYGPEKTPYLDTFHAVKEAARSVNFFKCFLKLYKHFQLGKSNHTIRKHVRCFASLLSVFVFDAKQKCSNVIKNDTKNMFLLFDLIFYQLTPLLKLIPESVAFPKNGEWHQVINLQFRQLH